ARGARGHARAHCEEGRAAHRLGGGRAAGGRGARARSRLTLGTALLSNFLGRSPEWYKRTIVAFLVLNPILFAINHYVAGWVLVLEFIFTLAMALRCYPLQPGGLLAIEAIAIGMATPATVYAETVNAIQVVLLLIFMVAGIFFLKDL